MSECPFCARVAEQSPSTDVADFPDAFPVSAGHTLVVPCVHEADLFALDPEVQTSVWMRVADVRERLRGTYSPDGFNIGVNAGAAAGQTVAHAHVHVIPRYSGDVPDPRGGIRWVIPDRAGYWGER